jgi:hypothetical protein
VNPKAATETAAVAMSAPVTFATAGAGPTLISMAVGLLGVWLARIVFVNRENRRLERSQPLRETLPVTLAACLIAGALIWDQRLSISTSAFLGLGVGWTTVLLLELFGDNVLNAMRALTGRGPLTPVRPRTGPTEVAPNPLPDDMVELLRQADEKDPDYKPPKK